MQQLQLWRDVSTAKVPIWMWEANTKMVRDVLKACMLIQRDNLGISNSDLVCFSRYHVPRSWLKPTQNLLIVFEEIGGDASRISLVKRSLAYV